MIFLSLMFSINLFAGQNLNADLASITITDPVLNGLPVCTGNGSSAAEIYICGIYGFDLVETVATEKQPASPNKCVMIYSENGQGMRLSWGRPNLAEVLKEVRCYKSLQN